MVVSKRQMYRRAKQMFIDITSSAYKKDNCESSVCANNIMYLLSMQTI